MKNTSRLLTTIFIVALLMPFILATIFPSFSNTAVENRTLAVFPDFRKTDLTDWTIGFEAWLKDHLPFKEMATKMYSKALFEIFHETSNEHVVVGKNGWFLYNGYINDNPIADLTGVSQFNDEEQQNILDRIDAFEAIHPNNPFVLFIAPNKENVYRELFPDSYQKCFIESGRVEKLAEYSSGKNKLCFCLEELKRWKNSYQVYYKYDTHWNVIGAYVGLKAICDRLSILLPPLNETIITSADKPFRRDLAYISNLSDYFNDDIEYDVIPYPDVTVDAGELELLYEQSLAYIRRFSSNVPNPQTVILVGDSFSEVMSDLVSRCFQNVIFVRRDTGNIKELHDMLEKLIAENENCIVIMEMVERGAWWLLQHDYPF